MTEKWKDERWLREKYFEQDMSQREIGDLLGYEPETISKLFKLHDISTYEKRRYRDEEWLHEKYVEQNMTMKEIAEVCDINPATVGRWLKRYDIETRPAHGREGKDNPNWAGGESVSYGSGWNRKKRKRVRELDNHRCIDCGMTQAKHQSEYGCKLHVHHLIKARDIDDAEERNAFGNLVTLCHSCHFNWEKISESGIKPQIERD
jgi:IS30 family transposase